MAEVLSLKRNWPFVGKQKLSNLCCFYMDNEITPTTIRMINCRTHTILAIWSTKNSLSTVCLRIFVVASVEADVENFRYNYTDSERQSRTNMDMASMPPPTTKALFPQVLPFSLPSLPLPHLVLPSRKRCKFPQRHRFWCILRGKNSLDSNYCMDFCILKFVKLLIKSPKNVSAHLSPTIDRDRRLWTWTHTCTAVASKIPL